MLLLPTSACIATYESQLSGFRSTGLRRLLHSASSASKRRSVTLNSNVWSRFLVVALAILHFRWLPVVVIVDDCNGCLEDSMELRSRDPGGSRRVDTRPTVGFCCDVGTDKWSDGYAWFCWRSLVHRVVVSTVAKMWDSRK